MRLLFKNQVKNHILKNQVKISILFENIGKRRVNARTAFLGYVSDIGLIDRGNYSPGAGWLVTSNDVYGNVG